MIGVAEVKEREREVEDPFVEIMNEHSPNLVEKVDIKFQKNRDPQVT